MAPYPLGDDLVRTLDICGFGDSKGLLTNPDPLMQALTSRRLHLPVNGILRLDFRSVSDMVISVQEGIVTFCVAFPHTAGEERYLLFANLEPHVRDALDQALKARQACSVHHRCDEAVVLFGSDSLVAYDNVVDDLAAHPCSTVDHIAERLRYGVGYMSSVLHDAYEKRLVGRGRRRVLPSAMARFIPPTLSRFRGFVYFPLWLPKGTEDRRVKG